MQNTSRGYRWELVICSLALLCLLGVVLAGPATADGPLRRLFRGTRTTQQPTSYVCENGVCYQMAAPVVTYAQPLAYQKPEPVAATTPTPVSVSVDIPIEEVKDNPFHREVIKAAVGAQRAGKITRIELMKLRVAMLAPAFRERAEELALIQVSSSGEELPFKFNEDGSIDKASINWEGLAAFLERLVPIILMLLKAFGV